MADNAWKYRASFARAADEAFDEVGEERGWPGILPYEVLEAIASRESDGTPSAQNPDTMDTAQGPQHATGLMQIVPYSGIWSTYEGATGRTLDPNMLWDPDVSADIAAVALSEKAHQIQYDGEVVTYTDEGIVEGVQDWPSVARIAWYGAGALGEAVTDGNAPKWFETPRVGGDPGTGEGGAGDGDAWENDIRKYISGFSQVASGDPSGMSIAAHIERGDWRGPDDPTRSGWNLFTSRGEGIGKFVDGVYDLPEDLAKSAVESKLAKEIGGAIQAALPRVGMVAAGLVLFAGGLFVVKGMAMGAAA